MHIKKRNTGLLRILQNHAVPCCVAMAMIPQAVFADEPLAIIEQGAGNDVIPTYQKSLTQSGWFALLDAGSPRLESAQFVLKRKGKANPADFGEDQDLWSSSHRSDSTLYFLKHASLKPGPVAKVQLSDYAKISDYEEATGLVLRFKGDSYAFAVERLDRIKPDLRRITIKTSSGSSLLYDWRKHPGATDENKELVRWAGDLDRDGRLDLIVEFSSYYNSATCLFLSAPAEPPNLMKRIGCWFTSA